MAFSEQLKAAVRKRALMRCCICNDIGVEIHHIVPQSEDGSDSESNAAPLCPSCHEKYGANPTKRKFITEIRDIWYERCEAKADLEAEQIKRAVSEAVSHLATREDVERLAVRNAENVLVEGRRVMSDPSPYSFTQEEYIHPRVVQELGGWLSDSGPSVSAVDLVMANRSNQFAGDIKVITDNGRCWVSYRNTNEEYSYAHIAKSPSGVNVLECSHWTGGSGIFKSILLVGFERDRILDEAASGELFSRGRILLKCLGSISLGDRYAGLIRYDDGLLSVGPDEGWFQRGQSASKKLPIL